MTKSDLITSLRGRIVVTADDLRQLGFPVSTRRALIRSGQLRPVRRGVYATPDGDGLDRHVIAALAVQAVAPDAIVSHESAAILHRLDLLRTPGPGVVSVTVPPGSPDSRPAAVARFQAKLSAEHRVCVNGVVATTVPRTVVDLARKLPFLEGVVVADSAIRTLKTSKKALRELAASQPRWPGAKRARRVIGFANGYAESVLESAARVLFAENSLPMPVLQREIEAGDSSYRVDFCWPDHRAIAEADGRVKYTRAFAGDPERRAVRQLTRDRWLRRAGYQVVHFTWAELFADDGVTVSAEIRAALG